MRGIAAGLAIVFALAGCAKSPHQTACDNVEALTAIRNDRLENLQPDDPISVLDDIRELDRDIQESARICQRGYSD